MEISDNAQLLSNSETLTLNTLIDKSKKQNIDNQEKESKKYILKKEPETPIEFYDVYP